MLRIILLCVAVAVVYDVLHDQVTARLCVEYFTIAHPPLFDTDDPTLLGLAWGALATWWVGLALGVALVLPEASRLSFPFGGREGHWVELTKIHRSHSLAGCILALAASVLCAE